MGLGFAGAATLSACSGGATTGAPSTGGSAATPPDVVAREVAIAEQSLIARYSEAIAAIPALAVHLEPIKAQHGEHLAAMGIEVPTAPPEPAPKNAQAAISMLRKAELVASIDRQASCVTCADSSLARVLAFIAASEASHVAVLQKVEESR